MRRSDTITRRAVLAGGLALAAPAVWRPAQAAPAGGIVEVKMVSDPLGAHVMFDPVGLLVEPGATIRWVVEANVHTATAYHPDNDRPLRIPEGAAPWESGYLVDPGAAFEVRLTMEGVYDYFCQPHEAAGMVGRIIVGRPSGPGTEPPGPDIPEAARRAFPSIERIMAENIVRAG